MWKFFYPPLALLVLFLTLVLTTAVQAFGWDAILEYFGAQTISEWFLDECYKRPWIASLVTLPISFVISGLYGHLWLPKRTTDRDIDSITWAVLGIIAGTIAGIIAGHRYFPQD